MNEELYYKNLFNRACARIHDILLGDDGQAYFEAEQFLVDNAEGDLKEKYPDNHMRYEKEAL